VSQPKAKTVSRGRPWYAGGLEFACTRCGRCCGGEPGYIWVTIQEVERAAAALGMDALDFCSAYVVEYDRGFSLRELDNGDCCMLSGGRCSIYAARPLQCRIWPFWPSNLADETAWQRAARRCPGIGHGRRWSLAEIAAQRDQMEI
jgi:Fe-S-cluster containining protein